jgi:5-hydroxyisourate hydrolase
VSTLSTHVLDTERGEPAVGVPVVLTTSAGSEQQVTDADGRVRFEAQVAGRTTLHFDTAAVSWFFPEVVLTFEVDPDRAHHHVPLLLSPFSYSTYRGS